MMGTIRAVLGFQAQAAMLWVGHTAFPPFPLQEVAGIKLQGRFGGKDRQPSPAYGVSEFRRRVQRIFAFSIIIQQEIVVVPAGIF